MTRPACLSRITALAALGALALSGCAHTPTPHYYVLSAPAATASSVGAEAARIGLGPITLPDYLDRPQIVTRATDSRLELSNEHRWAEPLAASFSRALLANLQSRVLNADIVLHPWRASLSIARQVQIEITRFDRDADGSFRLSARWSVAAAGDSARTQQSDIDIPINGKADDYDALVAAANSAVSALATTIAAQLQTP